MITSFTGPYFFLSNYHPLIGGSRLTAEHLFQAEKARNRWERMFILTADSPGEAKKRGKKCRLRKDWEEIKVEVMSEVLLVKFDMPGFKRLLLRTGDEELIEGNDWGDYFWGAVYNGSWWEGENMLGELLMDRRRLLR